MYRPNHLHPQSTSIFTRGNISNNALSSDCNYIHPDRYSRPCIDFGIGMNVMHSHQYQVSYPESKRSTKSIFEEKFESVSKLFKHFTSSEYVLVLWSILNTPRKKNLKKSLPSLHITLLMVTQTWKAEIAYHGSWVWFLFHFCKKNLAPRRGLCIRPKRHQY